MKKYSIISGIFEGFNFTGYILNDRVINVNSIGQSFSIDICIEIENTNETF